MSERLLLVGLTVTMALLITLHVTLVFGLAKHRPRSAALLALVVAPVAPWLGFRRGLRARSVAWLLAAGAQLIFRLATL